MAEHIYMFTGESTHVKFRADRCIINDIMDYFGSEAEFSEITENDMVVSVKVNEDDVCKWAMQYCDYVEVLHPDSLRDIIRNKIEILQKKYCGNQLV